MQDQMCSERRFAYAKKKRANTQTVPLLDSDFSVFVTISFRQRKHVTDSALELLNLV